MPTCVDILLVVTVFTSTNVYNILQASARISKQCLKRYGITQMIGRLFPNLHPVTRCFRPSGISCIRSPRKSNITHELESCGLYANLSLGGDVYPFRVTITKQYWGECCWRVYLTLYTCHFVYGCRRHRRNGLFFPCGTDTRDIRFWTLVSSEWSI